MQQIIDIEKYEQLQEILIQEIIEQIRFKLAQGGITGDQLRELTGEIAFSVASSLDDQANIEHEGVEVHPYLAFIGTESEVIHCGENSYGHEFVADIMKKVFSS
ncbi:MAG: hypothetical protein K1562_02340 [Candidatus Thiodiazotropha sp. (ex. Lucinisca nassula)]|nr:hypothetical protein [Candidatus Thiodiazotropha sp. (ex. Lucinisca nassula)]MBW9260434.1 hypothetical protein [Candidatus Thiodiazotropha sp. (ex. Lucinisca nassula)]